MSRLLNLRDAGAYIVGAAGIPYGYTLTIWGAGALCTSRFGLPGPAEAFEFVAGASVAYFGLAVSLRRASAPHRTKRSPLVLWENCAALPAVATTYGLSRLISGPGASFFLVPFAATFLYLIGVSLLASCFHFGPERLGPEPVGKHRAAVAGEEATTASVSYHLSQPPNAKPDCEEAGN